jgi:hypothetical protein
MNITLHRTTLMVCVLAGALALTIALVAAKDVSAAPPEPVDETPFTIEGLCAFPVTFEVSGKMKMIDLPGDRLLVLSPGQRVTLTNEDDPANQVTYVITGAFHITTLADGTQVEVFTGRNLILDPSGIFLAIGRFTYVVNSGMLATGKGRMIDVCARLA